MDLVSLRKALAAVPAESWSLPSTYTGTRVHHGYRRVVLVSAGRRQPGAKPFAQVLDEFEPVREAWLSWLDPGGFIIPHRDGAPWFERWQVPIQASGWFDDRRPVDGEPFQVKHWLRHSVWNDGDRPRIHIVIDRDVPIDLPPAPFETFLVPPQFVHLIESAR